MCVILLICVFFMVLCVNPCLFWCGAVVIPRLNDMVGVIFCVVVLIFCTVLRVGRLGLSERDGRINCCDTIELL